MRVKEYPELKPIPEPDLYDGRLLIDTMDGLHNIRADAINNERLVFWREGSLNGDLPFDIAIPDFEEPKKVWINKDHTMWDYRYQYFIDIQLKLRINLNALTDDPIVLRIFHAFGTKEDDTEEYVNLEDILLTPYFIAAGQTNPRLFYISRSYSNITVQQFLNNAIVINNVHNLKDNNTMQNVIDQENSSFCYKITARPYWVKYKNYYKENDF